MARPSPLRVDDEPEKKNDIYNPGFKSEPQSIIASFLKFLPKLFFFLMICHHSYRLIINSVTAVRPCINML